MAHSLSKSRLLVGNQDVEFSKFLVDLGNTFCFFFSRKLFGVLDFQLVLEQGQLTGGKLMTRGG